MRIEKETLVSSYLSFFFYGHVMTRGFLWSKRNDGRRMGKRKKVGKKNIKKEVD